MLEDKLSGIKSKIAVGIVYGAIALGGATLTYGCGTTGSYTPSSSSSSSYRENDRGGYRDHDKPSKDTGCRRESRGKH